MQILNDLDEFPAIFCNIAGPFFVLVSLLAYSGHYKCAKRDHSIIKRKKSTIYAIYSLWLIFIITDLSVTSKYFSITASLVIKLSLYFASITVISSMTMLYDSFHLKWQLVAVLSVPAVLSGIMLILRAEDWPVRTAECIIELIIVTSLMITKTPPTLSEQSFLLPEKDPKPCIWHLKILWSYMWPKGKYLLQFNIILAFLILAAGRGVNLLIPIYIKKIIDDVARLNTDSFQGFPWKNIVLYGIFTLISGQSGLLSGLKSFLWVPVSQNMNKNLMTKLYRHLLSLPFVWHLNKKTGEILRIVDRGTESFVNIIDYAIFRILPTIADAVIAVVYLSIAFNYIFGIIILVMMILYFGSTIIISQIRIKYRREMNDHSNDLKGKAVDIFMSFETVKTFSNEDYETGLYQNILGLFQKWEWKVLMSLQMLNMTQSAVFTLGMITSLVVMGRKISQQNTPYTVGDIALLITYFQQVKTPLNFLGTIYRMIIQAMVDMEKVFDLMKNQPEETNNKELVVTKGVVEFKNVSFSHQNQQHGSLSNITLTLAPNKVVAIVGETGSGKSTIVKLLLRLFKHKSGKITIDGQDITEVSLSSLRMAVNAVSQDSSLFNETIRFNVKYARPGCSETEMANACKLAEIDDFISKLMYGYDSYVGERGLILSGGEKQRVTIARSAIKGGNIVIFDEASSALDNVTEKKIFHNLRNFFHDCTQLIIAHRLSTIEDADEIIVLDEGKVVERGSHHELLKLEGHYYRLWSSQTGY